MCIKLSISSSTSSSTILDLLTKFWSRFMAILQVEVSVEKLHTVKKVTLSFPRVKFDYDVTAISSENTELFETTRKHSPVCVGGINYYKESAGEKLDFKSFTIPASRAKGVKPVQFVVYIHSVDDAHIALSFHRKGVIKMFDRVYTQDFVV